MRIMPMEAEVLLEALPEEDCRFDHNGDCQEHGFFGIDGKCPVAESKELISTALQAPAPVVTDEAVGKASSAYLARRYPDATVNANRVRPQSHEFGMRAALEAAAPLLAPRPLLDRDALEGILAAHQVGRHLPGAEAISGYRAVIADAVLALINGGAK